MCGSPRCSSQQCWEDGQFPGCIDMQTEQKIRPRKVVNIWCMHWWRGVCVCVWWYMPVKCDQAEGIWTWRSFASWNGNELLRRIRLSSTSCLLRRAQWRSNGSAWGRDIRECYRDIALLPRGRCEKMKPFSYLSVRYYATNSSRLDPHKTQREAVSLAFLFPL